MNKLKVGLLGSRGRMGTRVTQLLSTEFTKVAELTAEANLGDSLDPLLAADVVIDFSSPTGMSELARRAIESKQKLPAFVVGSTGWMAEEHRALEALAAKTPVLVSFNFSTGVLLLSEILKSAGPLFRKLGYTPVMVETHHRHKKDAPSGTALLLQRSLNTGNPEGNPSIQTLSVRAGEIIGDHTVTYYGPADTITLAHHAMDRTIFARGAIDVALWLARKHQTNPAIQGLIGIESYFEDLKCSN